jgi:hypothetical protein
MAAEALKFAPLASAVDAAFWALLAKKKLEEFKLDTAPRAIEGR